MKSIAILICATITALFVFAGTSNIALTGAAFFALLGVGVAADSRK